MTTCFRAFTTLVVLFSLAVLDLAAQAYEESLLLRFVAPNP